jgi:thiaminase/transcriptional activator TenA
MPEPLSARLLAMVAEQWERALAMPFITQVIDDTLADDVFARYMHWEGRFVDSSARALGAAILRAPNRAALIGHVRTLAMLVNDQFGSFDTSTGQRPGPRSGALAEPLIQQAVTAAERLSYTELVIAMLPSELLYEVWCRRAVGRPSARPEIADWVRVHTEPPFTAQVEFLVSEVDSLDVSDAELPALAALVARRIELEIDFHAAAFIAD